MASIATKYSIGDVVFFDAPQQIEKEFPCPDCLGEKKWKAVSPAGTEYEFDCPRCCARFKSDDRLNLKYPHFEACARELTVGSIQTNTYDDEQVKYMCKETGVGSGMVYPESHLHLTREEALKASAEQANARNKNPKDFVLPLYNARLELSDYQLKQVTELPNPKRRVKQ